MDVWLGLELEATGLGIGAMPNVNGLSLTPGRYLDEINQHRMSGTRDYKSLLSSHRVAGGITPSIGKDLDQSRLVIRVMNGMNSKKYKPIDYEEMRAKAQQMKFKANKALIKVKKLEKASKDGREQSLLKQHHAIWFKELSHLNSLCRRNSADLDICVKHGCESEDTGHLFESLEEFSSHVSVEFAEFKKSTIDPIWELREDLKFWLEQMERQRTGGQTSISVEELGSPADIIQTISSVQKQQLEIMEKLQNERLSLELELSTGLCGELSSRVERLPTTGIPPEALSLECPYQDLKISVLQEFLLIDQKYTERLEQLDSVYDSVISQEHGGWEADEHLQFLAILDQHPFDLAHRRQLYIDRLRREWPSKSRAEIVAHEDWSLSLKNYKNNRKSLINDWFRDRKELLNKAEAIFCEAVLEHRLQEAKSKRQQQQQAVCNVLYDKVQTWRVQKLEAMSIKQRILEEQMEAARQQRLEEEEQENKRRQKEKQKIQERHEKLADEKRIAAEQDRLRLEELQKLHAEQAAIDAERVRYREELELQKQEALHKKKEEEVLQDQEKEARLEALREKVRVVAEPDPYRLIKDTENWQNRRRPGEDVSFNINQPLFEINTFNSKQISSDPRVKLENRLREAGLHTTDYARHILSKTEPAKPPRKDTHHTLKLGD